MGTAFQQRRMRKQMALGFATALVASLLLTGVAGILLMATATAVAWGLGRWMAGLLGGLTGDTYGAVNEVAEVAVLLVAVAIATAALSIVGWPLPWRG